MSDYTPTTEEVREAIAEWTWSRRMFRPELAQSDGREFDRWCAEWEAEQGETEWEVEHGILLKIGGNWAETEWEPEQFDEVVAGYPHNEYVRAERKVTPWLPVPDTTNNESEGKA